MDNVNVIGLDLAKDNFHLVGLNNNGKQVTKKKLRRNKIKLYFIQLPACIVAMEGCASSHYWAREFEQMGHRVKILPAQYVKAYVRGNKNDYNDALAMRKKRGQVKY